jgi:hypothetical protein
MRRLVLFLILVLALPTAFSIWRVRPLHTASRPPRLRRPVAAALRGGWRRGVSDRANGRFRRPTVRRPGAERTGSGGQLGEGTLEEPFRKGRAKPVPSWFSPERADGRPGKADVPTFYGAGA